MSQANTLTKDVNSVAVGGGVSDLDGVTILPLLIDHTTGRLKISAITSGGSTSFAQFVLTATGTVNSVNKVFTFTSAPIIIVSDGVWYYPTDNNGNTQWTGTTTVTMVIPPTTSIFGIM